MNRQEFLQQAGMMAFGSLFLPHFPIKEKGKGDTVLIVGAGVSGLYLGRQLKKAGHEVQILEARSGVGGRIAEQRGFYETPLDLGAQWIHGKNKWKKIVETAGATTYWDEKNDGIKVAYKGELLADLPPEAYALLKHLQQQRHHLDGVSMREIARRFNGDTDFLDLVENLITDAATTAQNFSAGETAKMADKLQTIDYQLEGSTMFGFLEKNFTDLVRTNVQLRTAVTAIDYSGKQVSVFDSTGKKYLVDKVVLTVPITVLKSNAIKFYPPLPEEKTSAFRQIGMDKGLKVFLKLTQKIFDFPVFNARHTGYYIDPTKRDDTSDKGLLASLVMGRHAAAYYEHPEKAAENDLAELDRYFQGRASRHFEGILAQDWGNEPFIEGVYSHTLPCGEQARHIARKNVGGKLFFAGEAMNSRLNYGTVHGAVESAHAVLCEMK